MGRNEGGDLCGFGGKSSNKNKTFQQLFDSPKLGEGGERTAVFLPSPRHDVIVSGNVE